MPAQDNSASPVTVHEPEHLLEAVMSARKGEYQRLGEMLVSRGLLSRQDLEHALAALSHQPRMHLGEFLMQQGRLSREQLNEVLAEQLGMPRVRLSEFKLSASVTAEIPEDLALRYHVLPIVSLPDALVVATADLLNQDAVAALRFYTGKHIELVLASGSEIGTALARYYAPEGVLAPSDEVPREAGESSRRRELIEAEVAAERMPVVRLVNDLIRQAVHRGASDINIRPGKEGVAVYFRIDGAMRLLRDLEKNLLPGVVARIKIIARMDIAERRLPQDGHARVKVAGRHIDLRISVIPTTNGESVVVRILDKEQGVRPLEELGFSESDMRLLEELISRPQGMILVTGPTGSGKSTTLYAMLQRIKAGNPHVITIEDPVEYDIAGVEQIQVHPVIGYTFAEALRHILRHDPDVIMVGEVRDLETARISNKAALTGHLVLSTLHTNDAAGAVTRLIDMGVEPYLLSSTLAGVMAQRLVRLTCRHCQVPEQPAPLVREIMGVEDDEAFVTGSGCPHCDHTGYRGRTVVYELLPIRGELTSLIARGADSGAIHRVARAQGMSTLTQNALAMARRGDISLTTAYSVRLG